MGGSCYYATTTNVQENSTTKEKESRGHTLYSYVVVGVSSCGARACRTIEASPRIQIYRAFDYSYVVLEYKYSYAAGFRCTPVKSSSTSLEVHVSYVLDVTANECL